MEPTVFRSGTWSSSSAIGRRTWTTWSASTTGSRPRGSCAC